jgi:O-antigen/teichoic acid export membrane protein
VSESDALAPDPRDVLREGEAGPRVIRGGVLRALGYLSGVLLMAVASIFLLRYLGVVDFGRYATVMSLIAIASGVTDAGLTAVANRELAVRGREERSALMRNLIALRLVITPIGVLGAVGFALVAGYDRTLVYGTALAGIGLMLANAQATIALPLSAELRIGALTAAELLKQVVLVAGIATLVAVGASLAGFFALQIVAGGAVLAITPFLLKGSFVWRPAFDATQWRRLVTEALPIGAGFALNVIYFRTLIIMMSLIATGRETGLFATSFRIFEIFFGLAGVALPVAMPVLAAAKSDNARLRYVAQRITEVGVVVAVFLSLVLAILAEPVLELLGGDEYRGAAPILRVQALALVPVFLGQAWQLSLIAIRKQSALLLANGAALAVVLGLGLALIPPYEAMGAAVAAVAAEAVLALVLFGVLVRAEEGLRPNLFFVWKPGAAAGVAALALIVPGLPLVAAGIAAAVVYVLVAWRIRAVPSEVVDALRPRLALRRGE